MSDAEIKTLKNMPRRDLQKHIHDLYFYLNPCANCAENQFICRKKCSRLEMWKNMTEAVDIAFDGWQKAEEKIKDKKIQKK